MSKNNSYSSSSYNSFCDDNGVGVGKNLHETIQLASIASQGRNLYPIHNLANCHESGDGFEKYFATTKQFFQFFIFLRNR